ncbi:MAG: molybdenum cofactor biosynthesis protein [Omnitrophica WOR_2 bacterium RIFCSPHIGHO2_02_FULL_45_21]|nr:MAG: molybdenum cofactor biosynthesis protein [Omnitrophica WOR_2 bacterium RIFCSPHIGHO2_02_FULL_45_21]
MYKVVILTISDRCSRGEREDLSGKVIRELIKNLPLQVVKYEIIPDEVDIIKAKLIDYSDKLKVDLVLTDGGTGFTPRDVTPEATKAVIDKEVQGIPEAIRSGCFKLSPRAILSRAVAGMRGRTLIINFPGSPKAVKESLEVIMDIIVHALDMIAGQDHATCA